MLRRFPFTRTLATVCILSLKRLAVTCWLLLPGPQRNECIARAEADYGGCMARAEREFKR